MRVAYLLPGDEPRSGVRLEAGALAARHDVRLVRLGRGSTRDGALDGALDGADAVVATTPALLAAAARLAPPRAALVLREHRAVPHPDGPPAATLAGAALATLLVTPTETTGRWLASSLGDAAPPYAVVPPPLPDRPRPQASLDEPLVVAAARLVPDDRVGQLVRALHLLRDDLPGWRLRVLGAGPERPALRRLVRRLELEDRVELAGRCRDPRGEWARAGIAAVPARSRPFPRGAAEAQAAGVPVVGYDSPPGLREVVTHDVDGLLVPPGSLHALASALLRLAEDHDLRRTLGAAARRASARFALATVVRRWEELLEEAVDASRRPVVAPAPAPAVAARPTARRLAALRGPEVTPAEARRAALQAAVDAAAEVTDRWLVVPPAPRQAPVVLVPEQARSAYLEALAKLRTPPWLQLRVPGHHGRPEERVPVVDLAADGRPHTHAAVLVLAPAGLPDPAGAEVEVELADLRRGTLRPSRPDRSVPQVGPDDRLVAAEVCGVRVRTHPHLLRPSVRTRDFPVDAVYTWVDGTDPAWRRRRDERLAALGAAVPRAEASGAARYTSRDELRYSLRSVHAFAPWVRTIHVVTDRQVPPWLDRAHPRVRVVDHTALLDPADLPTFNSHAIETALHRIEGLSEHFLYFNDDVLLGRPVTPDRFFGVAGQVAVFLSTEAVGPDDPDAVPHLRAAMNNRALLERDHGRTVTRTLLHVPQPLRRSLLRELEQTYPAAFARTAAAPFRSPTDVSVTSSLAQHVALLTGRGCEAELRSAFLPLRSPVLPALMERVLTTRDHDALCLGDHHAYALPPRRVARLVAAFLEAYLPVPAPWELPGP